MAALARELLWCEGCHYRCHCCARAAFTDSILVRELLLQTLLWPEELALQVPLWCESCHYRRCSGPRAAITDAAMVRELQLQTGLWRYRYCSGAWAAITDAVLVRELPLQMPLWCEICHYRCRSGQSCHYRCRSGPGAAITYAALVRELQL